MAKILLVEDNEMNRDMLSRRLERKGYEVDLAVDGQEAVDKAKAGGYDLILMDMSLPEIDGWEATRILRSSPEAEKTPIIALTAHAMSGDRERCLEAGCDNFATKPIERKPLIRLILHHAGREPGPSPRRG